MKGNKAKKKDGNNVIIRVMRGEIILKTDSSVSLVCLWLAISLLPSVSLNKHIHAYSSLSLSFLFFSFLFSSSFLSLYVCLPHFLSLNLLHIVVLTPCLCILHIHTPPSTHLILTFAVLRTYMEFDLQILQSISLREPFLPITKSAKKNNKIDSK